MNENTIVVVQCWAGDAHQVDELMPVWQSYGVPIVLMSPADAPVERDYPNVRCISAGKRGWSGEHTIDRQIEHWKIINSFDQEYVFYPDADSFFVDNEFPEYVYADAVFSNQLSTYDWWNRVYHYAFEDQREGERELQVRWAANFLIEYAKTRKATIAEMHALCPYVMQPPYWFSQSTMTRMIEAAPAARERDDFPIPFIDWYWPAVAKQSGVDARGWGGDGVSLPLNHDGSQVGTKNMALEFATQMLASGQGRWIHSCKNGQTAELLIRERQKFLALQSQPPALSSFAEIQELIPDIKHNFFNDEGSSFFQDEGESVSIRIESE